MKIMVMQFERMFIRNIREPYKRQPPQMAATICGGMLYRKEYVPDYLEQKRMKSNGELEHVIVEGRHQPIVTKEEFEQGRKARHGRGCQRQAGRADNGHQLMPDSLRTRICDRKQGY